MKVLIFGGAGLVGSRFIELQKDMFELISPTINELDILDFASLQRKFTEVKPEVVINFAAFTKVDEAEKEVGEKLGIVYQVNVKAAANVAKAAKDVGSHLIYISTSYVFDGTKTDSPYIEEDQTNPLSWYGQTKLFGEEEVLNIHPKACIARIDMPYRSSFVLKSDFARFFYESLKEGLEVKAVSDQKITPILIDSLSSALAQLVKLKAEGIYHFAPTDFTSPIEFVRKLAAALNLSQSKISETSFTELYKSREVKRPQNPWMDSSKIRKLIGEGILKSVDEDLAQFVKQVSF